VSAGSAKRILTVVQPFANHNGGMLAFGPDGMLYIGMGDGGAGGDPFGNGQNLRTLLGKMLRLDVDHGDPYAIPQGNPFHERPDDGRAEIWATGLRNPWRFSFDFTAKLLIIGDVGQNRYEEMDVVDAARAGAN
jgi:glucose/arabinose dehydrogenase